MPDNVSDFYSEHLQEFTDQHSPENWSEEMKEMLEKFSDEVGGGKVLDAGCGPGFVSDFLSRKGVEVTGIDVSDDMIKYARRNMDGRFLKKDIRELEPEESSFSGIWCGATIFFLENEEEMREVLKDFRRMLKDNGVLYIDFKLGKGKTLKDKWDGEVFEYRISEEKVKELLEDSGFEAMIVKEFENSKKVKYLDYLCEIKESES